MKIERAWLFVTGVFVGTFATAFVRFAPANSSEWASWLQAVGAIVAVAVAIYVPYRQRVDGEARDRKRDELRRKEPLMSLRPIMARAGSLIERIPLNVNTDIYVEHFFTRESDPDAISTVRASLVAFPVQRLVDYQAIQSVFDMQDALKIAADESKGIREDDTWRANWAAKRQRIEDAAVKAHNAEKDFKAALDAAGVASYVRGSGSATIQLRSRGEAA